MVFSLGRTQRLTRLWLHYQGWLHVPEASTGPYQNCTQAVDFTRWSIVLAVEPKRAQTDGRSVGFREN